MGLLNHDWIAAASVKTLLDNLSWQARIDRGADNLLEQRLGARPGDRCLLVAELDDTLYDSSVVEAVAHRCRHHGVKATIVREVLVTSSEAFPVSLLELMRNVEHTVFFSRLGDYLRFTGVPVSSSLTNCYAYSESLLASAFACVSHNLMATLRNRLEAQLMAAREWRITCPLGTDVAGGFHRHGEGGADDNEFMISMFPEATFKPIACHSANGTVCISRWLMPGGAPKIEDPNLSFDGVVRCDVEAGMIRRIHGDSAAAQQVSRYYDRVAATLGISRNRVHSWHVGTHPQTYIEKAPDADFERWCALSFCSPRYLHFHTCGDEPPGEVAWSLFDCTVYIDGEMFWQDGEFVWLQSPEPAALLRQYPDGHWLLGPSRTIGVECGNTKVQITPQTTTNWSRYDND